LFVVSNEEAGFSRDCLVRNTEGKASHTYDVIGYHLSSHRVRTLLAGAMPARYVRLPNGGCLASRNSSLCTALTRYHNGAPAPLGIDLSAEGWPLDADREPGENECRSHGLVLLPAIGPDGALALLASPQARGRTGDERARSTFAVYLVTGATARPLAEVPGLPRALTWDADGSRLFLSVDGRLAVVDGALMVLEDSDDPSFMQRLVRVPLPESAPADG
jgi:hypothetical protein